MRVCGIDPGNNGAVCVIDSMSPSTPVLLDFFKASPYDIAKWLHQQQVDVVWVEELHSIFQVTAKANFGLGRSVGTALTIANIVTRGVAPRTVMPKVWQKFVGVTSKGKAIKNDVARLAAQLYPQVNLHGPKGGLRDGRSDALMIAHYGIHHTT
jgi:Holliday junction resolvasome RuvABC endonuclease subunit